MCAPTRKNQPVPMYLPPLNTRDLTAVLGHIPMLNRELCELEQELDDLVVFAPESTHIPVLLDEREMLREELLFCQAITTAA